MPDAPKVLRKWGTGTVLVLAALIGLLAFAIYIGITGWNMGSEGGGEPISVHGYIAMAFGILVTLALGIGLMTLMYYSSRHNRD